MRRILTIMFLSLFPLIVYADDTPTPTNTATKTPDPNRAGDAIRVLHRTLTTVLPTAVPTAFITPAHVVNTAEKWQKIEVVNKSDCDVVVSYDGTNAADIIPSSTAWTDDLAIDKRYYQGSIYIRGQAACSTGNVYISTRY